MTSPSNGVKRPRMAWFHRTQDKKPHLVKRQAKAYCGACSIHGLTYIAEDGRHFTEKILWSLLCLGSILLCIALFVPIYVKWQESPTYTTVASTNYPIWEIDFPAVTICSNNRVVAKELEKILLEEPWASDPSVQNDFEGFLDDMVGVLELYIYISEQGLSFDSLSVEEVRIINQYSGNLSTLLRGVMQPCQEMLVHCEWQGAEVDCKKLFEVRRTDTGFCCSFNTVTQAKQFVTEDGEPLSSDDFGNYLDVYDYYDYGTETSGSESGAESGSGSDEGNESGSGETDDSEPAEERRRRRRKRRKRETPEELEEDEETKKKPRRIYKQNSASTLLGLTVILNVDILNYDIFQNEFAGFRVLVHSPYDFPEVSSKGLAVGMGNVAYIGVAAQYTQSTDTVKSMALKKRGCVDKTEDLGQYADIKMQAFQNYSLPACLLECRARLIFQTCGCLPYYFPDFALIWKEDTICNVDGLACLALTTAQLNALDTGDSEEQEALGMLDGAECECPNSCEETIYTPELSQVKVTEDSHLFLKLEQTGKLLWNLTRPFEQDLENVTDPELKKGIRDQMNLEKKEQIGNLSVVHVYFRNLGIVKYTRDELYSVIDVIAAFGGIIGLCMGFSVLSGAELIYFFTIRLYNDHWMSKREMKRKEKEEEKKNEKKKKKKNIKKKKKAATV